MKNKNEEAVLKANFDAKTEALEKAAKTAKADTHNFFIYSECMKLYKNTMEKELDDISTYYRNGALQRIHDSAKNKSLAQVIYSCRYFKSMKVIFYLFCAVLLISICDSLKKNMKTVIK